MFVCLQAQAQAPVSLPQPSITNLAVIISRSAALLRILSTSVELLFMTLQPRLRPKTFCHGLQTKFILISSKSLAPPPSSGFSSAPRSFPFFIFFFSLLSSLPRACGF